MVFIILFCFFGSVTAQELCSSSSAFVYEDKDIMAVEISLEYKVIDRIDKTLLHIKIAPVILIKNRLFHS